MPRQETSTRKPATCGIDWGSTAIRASFLPRGELIVQSVWNSNSIPGHDERYQKGAFNSTLYLDGDGKVYMGETMDGERIPTPSKPYFVDSALRGADATRIHDGMKEILRAVLRQLVKTCNRGRDNGGPFYVDEFGLSYPAYWTEAERSKYLRLLTEVLPEFPDLTEGPEDPKVVFHQESLASAHNLFWSETHMSALLGNCTPREPTLLVVLDFGGHTLNGCMFSVVKTGPGNISYFRVGDTFTVGGGTMLWEDAIAACSSEVFEKQWKTRLPPRQRADLLKHFHLQIKEFTSSEVFGPMTLFYTGPGNMRASILEIPAIKAESCFWEALEAPVRLAREKITEAASLSTNVRVVLTGGSGKSPIVQEHMRQACRVASISDPYPFYEDAGDKDSWNIAKGAAIATASAISAHEFLKKGAAFGIQKTRRASYRGSPEEWEEKVELLLDYDLEKSYKTWATGTARFKIICDPCLQADEKRTILYPETSYDVVELPRPSKGYWRFYISLSIQEDDNVSLIIKADFLGSDGKKTPETKMFSILPLYFDSSANCCLLDTDVDCKGRGLMLSEEGRLVPCGEETTRDQIRDLQRNETGRQKKRRRPASPPKTVSKRAKPLSGRRKPQGRLPVLGATAAGRISRDFESSIVQQGDATIFVRQLTEEGCRVTIVDPSIPRTPIRSPESLSFWEKEKWTMPFFGRDFR